MKPHKQVLASLKMPSPSQQSPTKPSRWSSYCLLLLLLVVGPSLTSVNATLDHLHDTEFFQKPGVRVSEILKARGYSYEESRLVSDDGYVLGVTRGWNPLISRKRSRHLRREPFLFVHGTLVDGNAFVTNSFEVEEPKDFSHVDADKLTEDQLIMMFQKEPSAKSLPLFAMNCGHEVFFLHRRGSRMSQSRIDLGPKSRPAPPTVMEKYLAAIEYTKQRRGLERARRSADGAADEHDQLEAAGPPQAAAAGEQRLNRRSFDMFGGKKPGSASSSSKFGKSKSKLGQALKTAPAALLDYGNLLKDIKITFDQRLWNHSFDEQAAWDLPRAVDYVLEQTGQERLAIIGDSSGGALIMMALILEPKLDDKLSKAIAWVPSFNIGHTKNNENFAMAQPAFNYIGPYPFTFVSEPIQAIMEIACALEVMQKTLCTLATDSGWGPSHGLAPIRPEFESGYLIPVSAHEYLHLIQTHTRKSSRMFDFRDKQKNLLAYGQVDTPVYNASLINFEYLSIYVGTSDSLVTEEDIESVHRDMRVPHKIVTMKYPGINHGAVLFHEHVAKVVVLPTYKDIISHGYRAAGHRGHHHEGGRFEQDEDSSNEI